MSNPIPLEKAALMDFSKIKAVFFDIDDTFSTGSKILPEAYQSLWKLYSSGIHVIPVTGRPAGWCDHITRMWPVTAVVGENGAFYSYLTHSKGKTGKLVKKYLESEKIRISNAKKLRQLKTKIEKKFKGCKTSSDQLYREFDLSIDFCEDVAPWSDEKIENLVQFAKSHGAMAKPSSIHVNIWYGKYDKWTCVKKVLKNMLEIDPKTELNSVVYIGDSPNDEPFFKELPLTVGVANVEKFLSTMEHLPRFQTASVGGRGFAELGSKLLEARV